MNRPTMPFGGGAPRANPMQANPLQMLQQLRADPMQFIRQAGFKVPDNLTSPNDIIQHLMNSGQITQERYEQARQMASRLGFKK